MRSAESRGPTIAYNIYTIYIWILCRGRIPITDKVVPRNTVIRTAVPRSNQNLPRTQTTHTTATAAVVSPHIYKA